ncbi:MAG: hypothetical protein ACT4QA_03360 [Panacagrimonas sp.]
MNRRTLCVFAILAATAGVQSPAEAGEGNRFGSFGVSVGTDGIGMDYAYPFNPYLDGRVGYDFGSLSGQREEEGIDYDAELKFSAARLLLDYKPFGGGFRLSGGLYTGAPELDLKASGSDSVRLDDRRYNASGNLVGGIHFGNAAPYFGLGWGGTATGTGFGASFDLGVIFTGSPQVNLAVPSGFACDADDDSSCDPVTDGFDVNGGSEPAVAFRAAIEAEREELEDGAGDAKFWPVIRLGLHYRY